MCNLCSKLSGNYIYHLLKHWNIGTEIFMFPFKANEKKTFIVQ